LADLIAFGRPFIANPDLPDRIANDWPLNTVDASTMYGGRRKKAILIIQLTQINIDLMSYFANLCGWQNKDLGLLLPAQFLLKTSS